MHCIDRVVCYLLYTVHCQPRPKPVYSSGYKYVLLWSMPFLLRSLPFNLEHSTLTRSICPSLKPEFSSQTVRLTACRSHLPEQRTSVVYLSQYFLTFYLENKQQRISWLQAPQTERKSCSRRFFGNHCRNCRWLGLRRWYNFQHWCSFFEESWWKER